MANEEILADACWAFSYLSDGNDDDIEAIIGAGVCGRLIDLLRHPSSALFPSLRTIGNIVTGNDAQTQYVVDSGVLLCLFVLITNDNRRSVKKEACWTISNNAAGNQDQIQAVIDSKMIPQLVWLVANAEFEVKREAAWAITNATSRGTHEQIEYLVDQDCVKPLCDLLSCPDTKIVTIFLEGLENILRARDDGGHNDKYVVLPEDAGGVDKIEALEEHENNNIYEISVRILENYLAYDMYFDVDANKFECPSEQPSTSFMFD